MPSRIHFVATCPLLLLLGGVLGMRAQSPPAPPARPAEPVRLGVKTPGVSLPMSSINKQAVFAVEGSPDWSVVTSDSVWVTSSRANHIVQMMAATNKVGLVVDVPRPCSGIADGFGSIWSPACAAHQLYRVDPASGKVIAKIDADPQNSEGGITVGDGAVWLVIKPSTLVRIDPHTNSIAARYSLPAGSENPLFADGFLWVTSFELGNLLKLDPANGHIVATIPVGPKPRFLTVGAGSIWTLDQGDGGVSRVDLKTSKLVTRIACGIPGGGGEITFGKAHVWATMFDFPLTKIDPATNHVDKQWGGPGGDGIRFGFDSVWLSNGAMASVWRLSPDQP